MHDLDPNFWPLDMRDRCRVQATFGTGTGTSTSTGSTACTIIGTSTST